MGAKPYVGMKVNYVTLLYPFYKTTISQSKERKRLYWRVKCICGNELNARLERVVGKGRKIKSCGCKHSYGNHITHNLSKTRLYTIFRSMVERCENANSSAWEYYGSRGITICDEWRNDFKNFYDWSQKNGYNENLTIDRINNDGNYEPSNCRWVDYKTQARNTRSNRYIEIDGEVRCLSEWCEVLDVNIHTVKWRIAQGMDHKIALTKPIDERFRKNAL